MSPLNRPRNVPPDALIFSMEQLAGALLKAQGITEGLWRIGLHLNFAGATHQWQSEDKAEQAWMPTAHVGIAGVGLAPAAGTGPMVFDAAILNPAKPKRARARAVPKA